MKDEGNIKEIFDRALHRLGSPPAQALESARQRVLRNLRTADPSREDPLPPPLDTKPVSLWGLRQPFLIFAAVGLGVIVWSTLTLKVRPDLASPDVAVAIQEPLQSQELSSLRPEAPPPAPVETESSSLLPPEELPPPPVEGPSVIPIPRDNVEPVPAEVEPEEVKDEPVVLALEAPRIAVLPEGEGKTILDGACAGCHRADAVGSKHFSTRSAYEELISRMVAMGAVVSPAETTILADYLFDHFGGKGILERACVGCHSLQGMEKTVLDNVDAYRALVQTMISYGADIKDDEIAPLSDYLFRTYGKK